jgi:hypothetical protein
MPGEDTQLLGPGLVARGAAYDQLRGPPLRPGELKTLADVLDYYDRGHEHHGCAAGLIPHGGQWKPAMSLVNRGLAVVEWLHDERPGNYGRDEKRGIVLVEEAVPLVRRLLDESGRSASERQRGGA